MCCRATRRQELNSAAPRRWAGFNLRPSAPGANRRARGAHLKKVSLELGGKNSLIVLDGRGPRIGRLRMSSWGAYFPKSKSFKWHRGAFGSRAIEKAFVGAGGEIGALAGGDPAADQTRLGRFINEGATRSRRSHRSRPLSPPARTGDGRTFEKLFYRPPYLGRKARNARLGRALAPSRRSPHSSRRMKPSALAIKPTTGLRATSISNSACAPPRSDEACALACSTQHQTIITRSVHPLAVSARRENGTRSAGPPTGKSSRSGSG